MDNYRNPKVTLHYHPLRRRRSPCSLRKSCKWSPKMPIELSPQKKKLKRNTKTVMMKKKVWNESEDKFLQTNIPKYTSILQMHPLTFCVTGNWLALLFVYCKIQLRSQANEYRHGRVSDNFLFLYLKKKTNTSINIWNIICMVMKSIICSCYHKACAPTDRRSDYLPYAEVREVAADDKHFTGTKSSANGKKRI